MESTNCILHEGIINSMYYSVSGQSRETVHPDLTQEKRKLSTGRGK